jgi:hypothetical protein
MPDDQEPAKAPETADDGQPKVVGVLHFKLSAVNLGPDYPPSAVSARSAESPSPPPGSTRSTPCCCPPCTPADAPTGISRSSARA